MPRFFTAPSSAHLNRRGFLAATGALTLATALSACGGGDDTSGGTSAEPVGQADIDKAMKTPTELTFWTWVPNIDKEVALFEAKYPAVKIKVVNAYQGTPQYTKLRTALKAGSGAPDMVQIEYQAIPTFTITNSLLDLRPYGASALKDRFVDWTWSQVSGSKGEVWAIPQDTGPMGMLYRQDIFDRHGIEVPGTWDEFAAAARKLHKADPDVYLTNLAANQAAAWHGLLWQADAKPYVMSGRSDITVSVDDDVSKRLGAYWGTLAKEGVIGVEPDFTDSWYAGLNKGKYATWLTAAWGPVFLSGSAKATAGEVAGGTAAAVGRRQAQLGQLGRFDDRGHPGDQEPDRGGGVRAVPQHRPGQRRDVRHRAVLLPRDQGAARGRVLRRRAVPVLRRPEGQPGLRRHRHHGQHDVPVAAVPRPGGDGLDGDRRQVPRRQDRHRARARHLAVTAHHVRQDPGLHGPHVLTARRAPRGGAGPPVRTVPSPGKVR